MCSKTETEPESDPESGINQKHNRSTYNIYPEMIINLSGMCSFHKNFVQYNLE